MNKNIWILFCALSMSVMMSFSVTADVSEYCKSEVASQWGQNLSCHNMKGEKARMGFGICGSGADLNCGGASNTLYCCSEPTVFDHGADGSAIYKNFGQQMICEPGAVVTHFCGSGKDKNCEDGAQANSITCNKFSGIKLEDDSKWYNSDNFGQELFCPNATVMTGACGSGANKDCNGYVNQIRCTGYTIKTTN